MEPKSTGTLTHKLAELWEELQLVLTGRGSILDSILPALAFLVVNAGFGFLPALWSSLVVMAVFGLYRLLKRQSLLYVILGLAGAGLTVFFALQMGSLEGYILPDLVTGTVTIALCLGSVLARRPLVAWTSRLARSWPLEWYWHPRVRPAYSEVTLAWAVFFSARLVLEIVLAQNQNAALLSLAKLLSGWPATILLLVGSYLYGIWRLGNLAGPSVEEFRDHLPPPWKSQKRGF